MKYKFYFHSPIPSGGYLFPVVAPLRSELRPDFAIDLIQHEATRNDYQDLKEELSRTHHKDKHTYADKKTVFVNSILIKLRLDVD